MSQITSTNMDSLPKQFVSAMRTLFDIMDDKRTGYVKLIDIENRWRDDRTKGLPHGVIESLQKVASHDGLLTFERFCTGLKICLLKNQTMHASNRINRENVIKDSSLDQPSSKIHRPSSVHILNTNEAQNIDRNWKVVMNNDDSAQNKSNVVCHLISPKEDLQGHLKIPAIQPMKKANLQFGPPKPPRLEMCVERKDISKLTHKSAEKTFNVEEVPDEKIEYEELTRIVKEQDRGLGDGRSSNESQPQFRKASRRREPRRHTLHNGVDYNLLKRMKQIEQEKDILLQGLAAVDEAREWYLIHLTEVQEKMRYAGRMGAYMEPWSEAHQERLELLRARVFELNRQLRALAMGWQHGLLSMHMNLALPVTHSSLSGSHNRPNDASTLKSQNRMLTEEVNRKNEKISILEKEKSALIRELLIHRNNKN